MCDNKLKQWVEMAIRNEEFVSYTFNVQGKTDKDNGYLGNITFMTVSGKTKDGTEKTLNLVVKSSKESPNLRKQVPIKQAFEKEIYVYDRVVKAFENFQNETGVDHVGQLTPHCYATQKTGTSELLILEDLRPKDYGLWNRKIPMDFDHLKISLEGFGKWHALSLALKKEKPETFSKLTEKNINMFSEWFVKGQLIDHVWKTFTESKNSLSPNPGSKILEKLNFSRDDAEYTLVDLFFEEPEYHVVLHGDCWTNNFLYQYKKNCAKPSDIRFIDWQCSALGSPVLDLSYFLYCCCSGENLKNFNMLLEIYHNSLAAQLKQLGVDPDQVYPYKTLIRQWKRFSKYGIFLSAFILRFSLCEADEAPDFAELAEQGSSFVDNLSFSIKNENVYSERIKQNLLHYVQYA